MAGDQEDHVITMVSPSLDVRFEELESAGDYDIMKKEAGKVPRFMRNNQDLLDYFEPRFVSFGPIHHGKEKCLQPAEEYKLRFANYFVHDSGKEAKSLHQKVVDNYWTLMQSFDEEVVGNYNDQELAWMLFVDGCAVLQSILCVVTGTFEVLNIEPDQMALWEQDLLLLENQLPYQLLLDLMNSSEMKDVLRQSINDFINKHSLALQSYNKEEPKKLAHLLDYLWQIAVDKDKMDQQVDSTVKRNQASGRRQSVPWHHNVRELKTAGVNVKPGKGTLTGIDFFSKLFNFRPGYLSIPPVVVDYTTGFKLLNLIAYEMTGPGMLNYDGVTSYVLFLSSILEEAGDVKELIRARVLYNFLDNNDQVFQLFKYISTNLMPVPNDHEFHANVKSGIEAYYGNKYRIWMAQLFHDLFNRPWKILTFSASFSALLLTAIQALYPIFSPSGHGEDQVRKKFH